jgi:hypothetical protein
LVRFSCARFVVRPGPINTEFIVANNCIEGELYVLARHHKMCKLANWSCPNNITSCSHAPGHATKEQAKQLNVHKRGESST